MLRPVIPGSLAVFVGWYIAAVGFTYRELLVSLLLVTSLLALSAGKEGIRVGFTLWVLTLGMGYRTLPVTATLRLHPAEVLLLGLMVLLILSRMLGAERVHTPYPTWLLLFIPFWLWGWVPGLLAGRPVDVMFSEFRNFVLFIPLLILAHHALREETALGSAITVFYVTGTAVAALGTIEYLFPSVASLVPGFSAAPFAHRTGEGFSRAAFSFYGHQNATFLCVLSLPFAAYLVRYKNGTARKIALAVAGLIQFVAIFIAGHRSMWFIVFVQLLIWMQKRGGSVLAVLMTLSLSVGLYQVMPTSVQARVDSLILVLEGAPGDSSGIKRWERATGAMEVCTKEPFGLGWAGAGWVHSDFLQVAANLGVLAGLVFFGGFISRLWRLIRHVRTLDDGSTDGALALSMLLSFVACGWILSTQPVVVLTQSILPLWFVWVLVETQTGRWTTISPRADDAHTSLR